MSWQGRGSLKGAITAFTAARALTYISSESALYTVHFAFALFTIILPSHAVLSSCYDCCGFQYKDLITVMARDKQINKQADELQAV